MAERRRNLLRYLAGADKIARAQRDGRHARPFPEALGASATDRQITPG